MILNSSLKNYTDKVWNLINLRMKPRGLIDINISKEKNIKDVDIEAEELYKRILNIIEESDRMCRIWHGASCSEDRRMEAKVYGNVSVYKVKCIDGRKPRAFEGDADSLKTEASRIALDVVGSTGEIIPKQIEICIALSNTDKEPLEISLAHYDSCDPARGCAAIRFALNDLEGVAEDVWKFLTPEEIKTVFEARSESYEDANLVLLELTNSRAFTNFHNKVRLEKGLKSLAGVGITALFDTRTMGMELRTPLVTKDKDKLKYVPAKFRKVLKTTELARKLKDIDDSGFGKYKHKFATHNGFESYSKALTKLTEDLFKDKNESKKIKDFVGSFIELNYQELSLGQAKALEYRMLRTIAHQYLTGLLEYESHHPFSDHEEKYISVSQDANYPGKYVVELQSFRMSSPDSRIGSKRVDIAAKVMDSTNIDKGKAHILFISASVNKSDFEERNKAYREAVFKNIKFFRDLTSQLLIKDRISNGNIMPVGVLIDSQSGEVLDIVQENALYI